MSITFRQLEIFVAAAGDCNFRRTAERLGVSAPTVQKIERGEPSVGLGIAFEAATLTGVPLFHPDPDRLSVEAARASDRLAVLPRLARQPRRIDDDF